MNQSCLSTTVNPLKEYLILQFEPSKIIMQHPKTKVKYFYKEIILSNHNQLILQQLYERVNISHDNLINIHFHQWKQNVVGLLSEYYHTHLEDEILKRSRTKNYRKGTINTPFFTQQQLINTFLPIIQCLDMLHTQRLAHGHLKARNIIVNQNFQTKLCDALLINQNTENRQSILENAFFPPQFQYNNDITVEGDLWALGIVMLQTTILESLEPFYDRANGKIKINDIQSKIDDINQEISDEYVVAIKLLLSSDKIMRNQGVKVLKEGCIPEGMMYEKMRPQRKKINERFYQSQSPKKSSQVNQKQFSMCLNSTQLQSGRLIYKQEVLNQSNNFLECKKTKADLIKQKYRSKHSQQIQIKKKQIDNINKIIERSNAFVNDLMAKRNDKPVKIPSLNRKTSINLSMNGCNRQFLNQNYRKCEKTVIKEKQQKQRQNILSNGALLTSQMQIKTSESLRSSPKKLYLKRHPQKLKSLSKKK